MEIPPTTTLDRELYLMETFVGLLSDHRKDFEGFVHNVGNIRYHHTPIDGQQINRCEYALRNMEIRLLTIHNCIQVGRFDAETLDALTQAKHTWASMKNRVDGYLGEIHQIISQTPAALRPMRESLVT